MKKLYTNMLVCLSLLLLSFITQAQSTCESVSVVPVPMDPQSSTYNYFGVRVVIPQTVSQDVTVTGYIFDESNRNTNNPFTLTITAGNTSAETSSNFYQTSPAVSAEVEISSVSNCPDDEILIQKFVSEFPQTTYQSLLNQYSLGTLNMNEAEVDTVHDVNQTPFKFVKVPAYSNNNIRAGVLGFVDPNNTFKFSVIEFSIAANNVVDMNFYSPQDGHYLGVHFEGSILKRVDHIVQSPIESMGECIGRTYDGCKQRCDADRSCRVSCDFWNDWFRGSCSKAMWAGAIASCMGGLYSHACGGFD